MNIFDIAVLAIMVVCIGLGYRRGLIRTVFGLGSFVVSILLANRLYPYVSRFLRGTALYDSLKDAVIHSMNLRAVFTAHTAQTQTELINSLPIPDTFRDALYAYNTPDMYELLNVSTIEDYIGGYFANIALNIISMAVVFVLVWVLMKLIGNALDIIGRLPVINTFNRAGGLAAGIAMGVLLVWAGFALMNLLFVNPSHPEIFAMLNTSAAAKWLYGNNLLVPLLTKIQ